MDICLQRKASAQSSGSRAAPRGTIAPRGASATARGRGGRGGATVQFRQPMPPMPVLLADPVITATATPGTQRVPHLNVTHTSAGVHITGQLINPTAQFKVKDSKKVEYSKMSWKNKLAYVQKLLTKKESAAAAVSSLGNAVAIGSVIDVDFDGNEYLAELAKKAAEGRRERALNTKGFYIGRSRSKGGGKRKK